MKGKTFKVDKFNDTFFKDKFDYNGFEDNIYTQFAKMMARNVDIDLAKTPLVDILTGYTRYRESEYICEQLRTIITKAKVHLLNSKEYKMAKEMGLTEAMSILVEIKTILDEARDYESKKENGLIFEKEKNE